LAWIAAGLFALVAAAVGFLYFRQKPPETPVVRFTVMPPETAHFAFGTDEGPDGFPAVSPDGRRMVFGAQQAGRSRRLWVRSLDATISQPLNGTEGASIPFWSADGHFMGFGANGKLKKMDLSGGPAVLLADAPSFRGASWSPQGVILFAPVRTGALLMIPAAGGVPSPATVIDPSRKEQSHRWPWFLPDGRHFLYSAVAFNSSGRGHLDLYRKLTSGAGAEELLYADGLNKAPTSWSPDGKFVMYDSFDDRKTRNDIWVLPVEGEPKPVPFLKTAFNEYNGRFSPDGRWVAYTSDESGRAEIYISPFPGAGGKRLVSLAGGDQARWRADGKELFYLAPDGQLMAGEVRIKGTDLEIGTVRPLFGPLLPIGYDVSSDGQRFLAVLPEERAAAPDPLTVVMNWTAGLKK
jgi:Tol biopolymer transport system component